MTPSAIEATQKYLATQFPGSKWTQEIYDGFGLRLAKLDITAEQACAVIGEYRWNATRYEKTTPDPARLMLMLKSAEPRPVAVYNGGNPNQDTPSDPPIHGWEIELVQRHRTNPDDPVFARLEKKHRAAGTIDIFRDRWRKAAAMADGRRV